MDVNSPLAIAGYLALTLVLLLTAVAFEAKANATEDPKRRISAVLGSCIAMLALTWVSCAFAVLHDSRVVSAAAWAFTALWTLFSLLSFAAIYRAYRERTPAPEVTVRRPKRILGPVNESVPIDDGDSDPAS